MVEFCHLWWPSLIYPWLVQYLVFEYISWKLYTTCLIICVCCNAKLTPVLVPRTYLVLSLIILCSEDFVLCDLEEKLTILGVNTNWGQYNLTLNARFDCTIRLFECIHNNCWWLKYTFTCFNNLCTETWFGNVIFKFVCVAIRFSIVNSTLVCCD